MVKLKNILSLGAKIIGSANPAVGAAITAVNAFLPEYKKLPETASVEEVQSAVDSLPPEAQSSLLEKEIDYKIAESNNHKDIQIALSRADSTGSSTRPFIAKMMAWFFVLSASPLMIALAYAVYKSDQELITVVGNAWPLCLAMLGLPAWVIKAYFGHRTEEKKARYAVAHNQPIPGGEGLIKTVKGLFS